METPAGPVLQRIREGGGFQNEEDRRNLARFIVFQHLRTTAHLEVLVGGNEVLDRLSPSGPEQPPPATGDLFERAFKFAPAAQDLILGRKWSLVHTSADSDARFLTSDNPVTVFDERRGAIDPGGLTYEQVEITLPLSPQVCLVISERNDLAPGISTLPDPIVEILNRRTMLNAWSQVFSPTQLLPAELDFWESRGEDKPERFDPVAFEEVVRLLQHLFVADRTALEAIVSGEVSLDPERAGAGTLAAAVLNADLLRQAIHATSASGAESGD